MIWLRRFLILPMGLVFVVLFVLTLVIFRLSETFLEPEFYKDELAKAGIYNFALVDLPTSGIEELRSKAPDFFSETLTENPLDTTGLTADDIVSSFGKILPPAWVQEQVEQVIDQAGGYITGESDSFEINVTAAERVTATTEEVKTLVRKALLHDLLFDEFVTPEIDKALSEEGTLPFNVSLTGEDLVAAVQRVAPEDWVKDQVDHALDEVTAYMVGDQDTFEIKVLLAERADIALDEIKILLMKANFFELLFDEVVDPMLEGSLSQFTELPFGVGITQQEISSALRELVPPSWLQEQVLGVIDEAGPYLVGRTDSFQAVIPLADRREVALTIIADLAESKLNALIEGLPECGIGQLPFQGLLPSLDELPQCIPAGFDAQTLMDILDIDFTGGVGEMIGSQIPDEVVYTETDLRQAIGGDPASSNLDVLDNMREIIGQGWSYTEVDLREDLGQDSTNVLDDVRAALSDGWTYSDVDFRENLADAEGGAFLENFDTFREQLARARNLRFLVYILWAVLLALIGVLGGRHWGSKIAWAAATLAISSIIVFIASGPVYNFIGQSKIDDLRVDLVQDMESPTQLLAVEKGLDVVQMVADDFLGGIERSSLTLLVIALVAFVAALAWPKYVRRTSPAEEAETN
ncbi:MAG: hypothetical protein O2783_02695 [Chloroflexi bacterium]|nr:hypothetical protein [Chloroflexota bacterium]